MPSTQAAQSAGIENLRDRLTLSTPSSQPTQLTQPSAPEDPLKSMSAEALAELGQNDKQGFFNALRPAAEEAERLYGVPAEITLAQAALETGWGAHTIMSEDGHTGFNLFGMKGEGTAGSMTKSTQEWENGHYVTIDAKFALYNNFYEAVVEHGKRFHNGYYEKAIGQFPQDHSWQNFAANIQGIYATDPQYSSKLIDLVGAYGLDQAGETGVAYA